MADEFTLTDFAPAKEDEFSLSDFKPPPTTWDASRIPALPPSPRLAGAREMDIAKSPEQMVRPFVPIPRIEAKTTAGKIAAAPVNVASSFIQGAETPLGVALAPAAALGWAARAAMGLGFGLPVAKAGLKKVYEGAAMGEPGQVAEGALETLGGGLMAAGGAREVVNRAAPILPRAAQAATEAIAEQPKPTEVPSATQERSVQESSQPEHTGTAPLGVSREAGGGNRPEPAKEVTPNEVVLTPPEAPSEAPRRFVWPGHESLVSKDVATGKWRVTEFQVMADGTLKPLRHDLFQSYTEAVLDQSQNLNRKEVTPPTTPEPPATEQVASVAATPAVAKVATEVKKVARTEGSKVAKEVKTELVGRLEKAIEDAPAQAEFDSIRGTALTDKAKGADIKVTINIPGDGDFTILNRKENLTELLARAKRISTTSGTPAKAPTTREAPDIADQATAAARAYGSAEAAYKSAKRQKAALQAQEPPATKEERESWNKQIENADYLMRELFGKTKAGELEAKAEGARDALANYEEGARGFRQEFERLDKIKRKTAAHKERLEDLQRRYAQNQEFIAKNTFQAEQWEQQAAKERAALEAPPPPTPGAGPGTPEIKGMGGATPSEFGQPGDYVSNMFAAIDRDRVAMGKQPMEKAKGRTWDEDNARALAQMNRDPNWIPNLIKSVTEKPRPLMSWENAGVVWHRAKLKAEANNAFARINQAFEDGRQDALAEAKQDAARFEDELDAIDKAVGRGGTGSEAGRTLKAQQMGAGDDFTLVEMRLAKRAAKGGERLTPKEEQDVAALHKKLTETQQAFEKYVTTTQSKLADLEIKAAFNRMARETSQPPPPSKIILEVAQRIVKQLDIRADAARARIRERMARTSAGVDPTLLLDLAEVGASHLAHAALDFGAWSAKMVQDLGEWVRPHLQNVFTESQKRIYAFGEGIENKAKADAVERAVTKQTPEQQTKGFSDKVKELVGSGKKDKVTYYLQRLARLLYQQGIKEREPMVDALHKVMSEADPSITRRETMDAWSGYGDYKQLSKDEITVALRGMKGELQQIAKLEDMTKGQPPLKSGIERRTPTDAERQLIRLVNDAKAKFQIPVQDPETQLKSALDTIKTTMRNRIVDYQDRIARKDYAPRPRREIMLDAEATRLKADAERVKQEFRRGLEADRLAKRKPWQKALDTFVKVERAFKLSSPVVFGKLTAAAITRIGATATEEVAGGVLGQVPGIKPIARMAPREGGLNVRAMAKGMTEAINRGMDDAVKTAKTGKTDLDVLLGERGGIDRDWTNFLGQLHGMMKAPIKRAEYALSLEKRIAHAIENGVDVSDPMVKTRLMTEALNDGYRSIFMQRGFTADMFNSLTRMMEKSTKYPITGEVASRMARFFFPIVRVPINIVSETATGITGLPVASTRAMLLAMRGGIKEAFPEITNPTQRLLAQQQLSDSIMRQFKKGSIGAGLIAIGYLSPQAVGGYDWREKRQRGEVKTGGFQVAGKDIPRWMTHAPWFELMQFGATIRHVKEQHIRRTGEERGIGEGAWAAALGLLEETPFVGQMLRVDKVFNPSQRSQYLGELTKSTVIPQAVQSIAAWTDEAEKRKPKTFLENVEMGVPGLRQNVPEKR